MDYERKVELKAKQQDYFQHISHRRQVTQTASCHMFLRSEEKGSFLGNLKNENKCSCLLERGEQAPEVNISQTSSCTLIPRTQSLSAVTSSDGEPGSGALQLQHRLTSAGFHVESTCKIKHNGHCCNTTGRGTSCFRTDPKAAGGTEECTPYGTAEGGSVWLYALLSLLVRLGGIAGVFTVFLYFYPHIAKTSKPTASSKNKKTKHQFQIL